MKVCFHVKAKDELRAWIGPAGIASSIARRVEVLVEVLDVGVQVDPVDAARVAHLNLCLLSHCQVDTLSGCLSVSLSLRSVTLLALTFPLYSLHTSILDLVSMHSAKYYTPTNRPENQWKFSVAVAM